jgi:thioredoxin 1
MKNLVYLQNEENPEHFNNIIMVEILTDASFQEKVINSDKLAVVDFSAVWCGPCRIVSPIIHELATEYEGRIVVGEVNVDENPQVTAQFKVRNIPTVLFIKGGEVVDKQVGAVPKASYKALVEKNL